jgi:dienelactone hydrolase
VLINRLPRWLLLPVLVVAVFALAPAAEGEDQPHVTVGFASVDLTPDKPVPLAGYAARKGALSTGVHDKIMARAIALRAGRRSAIVLVSLDLLGVSADVRRAVAEQLGPAWLEAVDHPKDTTGPRLILTATHTHAGPGGLSDAPAWRPMMGTYDKGLRTEMINRIAACVREALTRTVPAHLRMASAPVAALQRNRRHEHGPLAPSLGVLRIEDASRKLIGAVVHYAAHPTILPAQTREISADWPGAVVRKLEAMHPGMHAMVLAGALGDIAPRVPPAPEGAPDAPFDRVERYGTALSARAEQVLEAAADSEALFRPFYEEQHIEGRTVAGALLGRQSKGSLGAVESVPLAVGKLEFDPAHKLWFFPGEPVAAYEGLLAPGPGSWVVACANDHVGYFADRAAFRRGGYEADLSFFGPDVFEELIGRIETPKLSQHGPAPFPPWLDASPREVDTLRLISTRYVSVRTPWALTALMTHRPGFLLGMSHGSQLDKEIVDLLTEADNALRKHALGRGAAALLTPFAKELGVPSEELVIPFLVRAARKLQRYIPEEYLDEMEGVARGAGVPYDAILLENTFLTLAEQTNPVKLLDLPARCTNVVALGESTSMGQLIHASTLDWGLGDVLGPRAMPILYEPARGHPFVSITWPGMVGTLRAMSAQGISITEESTAAPEDTGMSGIPINFLMRKTVQYADTLEDAVNVIKTGPGTCGYKVTIASGQALDARVVEVTATHHEIRRPIGGLLTGCDPGAPDEAFVGPKDDTIPSDDKSSRRRYPALRRLLAQAPGTLRLPLITHALSQTADGILNDGTLLACAFEPQTLQVHVAVGDDVDFEAGQVDFRIHDLFANLPAATRVRYTSPPPVTKTGAVDTTPSKHEFEGVEIFDVRFKSPVTTGIRELDRVEAQLFLPKDPLGVVIELPAWKERTLAAHRMLAMQLAKHRIATLVLPLPGQVSRRPAGTRPGQLTLSDNLATTRRAFIQGLADVRRASLYLERQHGFAPAQQAISGISLGGHAAALAMGQNLERFKAGVFILAGARIQDAFLNANPITGGITRALRSRGVHRAESATMIGAMEPALVADKTRAADVMLIAADKDEVIAPKNAELLAAAWGGARLEWLQGGHYAILGSIPRVVSLMAEHLTKAFQQK